MWRNNEQAAGFAGPGRRSPRHPRRLSEEEINHPRHRSLSSEEAHRYNGEEFAREKLSMIPRSKSRIERSPTRISGTAALSRREGRSGRPEGLGPGGRRPRRPKAGWVDHRLRRAGDPFRTGCGTRCCRDPAPGQNDAWSRRPTFLDRRDRGSTASPGPARICGRSRMVKRFAGPKPNGLLPERITRPRCAGGSAATSGDSYARIVARDD